MPGEQSNERSDVPVSADRCDLLCLDAPTAERLRRERLPAGVVEVAAARAQRLADPTPLVLDAALLNADALCVGLASVTAVTMPLLAAAKTSRRRRAALLGNGRGDRPDPALRLPSVALLFGLSADALLGWWSADPLAAFAIAAVAVVEGRSSWRGEGCCELC